MDPIEQRSLIMAHEYELEEYNLYPNTSAVNYLQDAGDYQMAETLDEYSDDIEYSSPSPSERRIQPGSNFTYQMEYQPSGRNAFNEEITQYEDEDLYRREMNEFQPPHVSNGTHRFPATPPPFHSNSIEFNHGLKYPSQHQLFNQPQSRYDNWESPAQHYQPYQNLHRGPSQPSDGFRVPASLENVSRGSNPRNAHGIRLRPVSELPDIFRGIFKFGVFNAVQSTCFDAVMASAENLVISAPTGSGKTVLFELSIIRMLSEAKTNGKSVKCVYMAPTKALCSERYRDWTAKFDALGIKCCELTGDTVQFGKGVWGDAKKATIIITTGEKWDSLTRNWHDHGQILSQIQLFLVDEVHILNETRGSTLEVVISRMKTRGTAVRFVMVSATVPNIEDIGNWVGSLHSNEKSAKVFEFGEEFRPCKLTRFVYGIPRPKGMNDFQFVRNLDTRLFQVLQKHSVGKPILVFCATRKGVFTTAETLMKDYKAAVEKKQSLPWSQPIRIEHLFHDKRLADFVLAGVGVHHAGLSLDDRRAMEDLYLRKIIRVIVATSTLAVGVNLPAHTVVIKGVKTFQNNTNVEYSDLDVMQMLGRAGRPQFDKDGLAIIMCETELEPKYKALTQGRTILESCLHHNLSEHLNSEVGLGTITSVDSAKEWLRSSFLFQRIQRNPAYYGLGKAKDQTWEDRVDDLVMQNVVKLQESELVTYAKEGSDGGELGSTEYGDIMSKFYIRQSTMSLILALPERASVREILEAISAAEEISDTKLRVSEKKPLNNLRTHNDIRFQIKKIDKTSDKVFLLIQAVLGGISLNSAEYKSADSQPQLEVFAIFKHIARIARTVVEVGIVKKLGAHVKHGLELVRCLTAKAWEDRPVVLRQIEQIGEKSLKVLAEHGITSLQLLRKQDPLRLEVLLNRRPPFGFEVLSSVRELPEYFLSITELAIKSDGGTKPVEAELSIECGLAVEQASASKAKKLKTRGGGWTAVLTLTSDMDFVDFRRISTKALKEKKTFEVTAYLAKPSQSIIVYIASESDAGVTVTRTYKPQVAAKEYPTMDTRPRTAVEMDLEGLEDDPEFWNNMNFDNDEVEVMPVIDLTKPQSKKIKATQAGSVCPSMQAGSKAIRQSDHPSSKKLPNGNFECKHSCKNKDGCRHLCCRDGLPGPSTAPKKRNAVVTKKTKIDPSISSPKSSTPVSNSDGSIGPKNQPVTTDRRLDDLKLLHERTSGLKLPEGKRLKLENSSASGKRRRPVPNFDIELTDLRDGNCDLVTKHNIQATDDGDDDLPEPYDILNYPSQEVLQTTSPETNYSNSELDALIRDIPIETNENENEQHSQPQASATHYRRTSPLFLKRRLSTLSPSLKQAQTSQNDAPKSKRVKIDIEESDSEEIEMSAPIPNFPPTRLQKTDEPLFLSSVSDMQDREDEISQHPTKLIGQYLTQEEDFSIDYSLFDISPATPSLTMSASASDDERKAFGSNNFSTQDTALSLGHKDQLTTNSHIRQHIDSERSLFDKEPGFIEERDYYAEFEAFLKSGAIEIVDK